MTRSSALGAGLLVASDLGGTPRSVADLTGWRLVNRDAGSEAPRLLQRALAAAFGLGFVPLAEEERDVILVCRPAARPEASPISCRGATPQLPGSSLRCDERSNSQSGAISLAERLRRRRTR